MKKFVFVLLLIFLPVSLFSQTAKIRPVLKKSSLSTSLNQNSIDRTRPKPSYNILAIRVDFQEDENILTTGNGKFDYSDTSDAIVDPPPHDRQYFTDHLEALKKYYARVSGGKLGLTYSLFPDGERSSYTLPNMMEYYNPNTTEAELDQRLAELIEDAVQIADNDPAVVFSDYDAVIIFHAGVGSEYALEEEALDPTPHDIPSVFLNLIDLKNTIGGGAADYEGISVDGGTGYVTNAVLVPETESKRDYEIGLNGIVAHQFGHVLGLPSLFNTENGRPAIGKWGLMGVGFANFDGIIPAEPCAWSKVFLGWEIPVEITEGSNFQVVPPNAISGTKIYKVPISPTEYYLIENRQTDSDGDSINVTIAASGVVIEVDDYDTDIPGSGILIWHIDERVIAGGLIENKVNVNKYHRGVDLEEADGSQDIGEVFPGIIPGTLTPENGLPWDAFYDGNNTSFTPETAPSTLSNYRGNSHINITDISSSSNNMTFSVNRNYYFEGFPKYLGGSFSEMAPMFINSGSVDEVKIIAANRVGEVFALDGHNQPLFNNGSTSDYINLLADTSTFGIPLFIDIGESIVTQPAVRLNNILPTTLDNKLFIATDMEKIHLYSFEDNNSDNYGDLVTSWNLSSPVSAPLMITQWLVTGHEDGRIRFFDRNGFQESVFNVGSNRVTGITGGEFQTGSTLQAVTIGINPIGNSHQIINQSGTGSSYQISNPFSPILSAFSGTANELILLNNEGKLLIDDLYGSSPEEVNLNISIKYEPVLGDINGDGYRDIIIVSENKVFAVNRNGSIITEFPVNLYEKGLEGTVTTSPVLGDIDGDNKQDIIFGTSDGNVVAIGEDGNIKNGFPLVAGGRIEGSLTILRSADSDNMELSALDENGFLYLWDLETTYNDKIISWGTLGRNNAHLRHNEEELVRIALPVDPAEENQLMPSGKVYNWPNPNIENWTKIRYYLTSAAEIKIKIFTQVGELVAELEGPGIPETDNEVTWDLTGIESGVYLAEVIAKNSSTTSRKVIKIAVIK